MPRAHHPPFDVSTLDCVTASVSIAYGIYEISESVGSVLGNGIVGYLRDTTHSWDADISIFAGMAASATLLTIGLILLDRYEWAGLTSSDDGDSGTGSAITGSPYDVSRHGGLNKLSMRREGSLNRSSIETATEYDRIKERFNEKAERWQQVEAQVRAEKEEAQAALNARQNGGSNNV
jgi:hypothetical protein